MNLKNHHRKLAGVTLVELLTVMSIVAVLLGIAIPSYRYVTTSNRMSGEVNGLLGDLQFARVEAIREGQPASVCASSNGTSCLTGVSVPWNGGWIAFSDANGNGVVDGPDAILRVQTVFQGSDTLTTNNVSVITFNREGFTSTAAGSALFTLHATPVDNNTTRCLSVILVGMTAINKYDGSTCL